jgi:hypothetical protein
MLTAQFRGGLQVQIDNDVIVAAHNQQ